MQQDKSFPRQERTKNIFSYMYLCVCVCLSAPFFCVALRALDILSDEVLVELSAAYRRMVSHSAPRNLTICIILSITFMFTYLLFCLALFSP